MPPALSGNENTAIPLAGVSVADTPNTGDTLTTVLTVTNGTLSVPGGSGNGTGTVTLTGTAAAINTALAGASYTGNLNFHGTDTLSVTTTDGGGHSSGAHTAAITVADTAIVSESVPPALSGNENTAIPLAGVSVADTPNTGDTLTTVLTVSNGTITVATPGGIVANNGTGTVTLTGTAAAINTALAGASYTGNLNFHGTDTLSVTTTDGGGHSSGAHTAAITVADTAIVSESVPPALSGNGHTAIPLAGVSVADTPNTGDTLTTVLTVSNGTITVATPGGIVANNGTGTVTLTGTAAAINTALRGRELHRQPQLPWHRHAVGDDDGRRRPQLGRPDGGDHGRGYGDRIRKRAAALSGNENTAIPLSVSVSDTNTGDTLTTVLTVTNGTLSVPGGSGNGTGTVTLTGTAAAINTALAGASYTGNLNFHGTDTLSVTTTDGGGHSSGAQTAAITVAGTAVITETVAAASGNENTAIPLSVSVSDTNTGDTLTTVLTVSNGTLSVPGGSGNVTGTVTLTGTAAAINTALAGASYTGNLNFHGTDTLSVTTTDGGGHSSGAHTAAITVADTAIVSKACRRR